MTEETSLTIRYSKQLIHEHTSSTDRFWLCWWRGLNSDRFPGHQGIALGGIGASCSHSFAAPCSQGVVLGSPVVSVKELLEPLQELKVVLESTLHQLVYWHYLRSRHDKAKRKEQNKKITPKPHGALRVRQT